MTAKSIAFFKSKSFIITGGTRGIGRGLAACLLKQGARVAISGRDGKRLQSTLKEFQGLGGEAIGAAGDVANEADCRKLAESARAAFGPIDFLINNAAILARPAPVVETPAQVWEEVLRINVIGTVNMIRHVLPGMERRRSGVIINLSSYWGRIGEGRVASYCASKFAVEGLTQSLAREVGQGLVVLALSPGVIATDMLATAFESDVSSYPSPDDLAPKWIHLLQSIKPDWNGRSLNLEDF
ncbi:MAG: SDR family oxidoreductase [Planctomycetes bacterium]|nr:SDR family oxidoreductase [Planctomycetota bacterium]